MSLPLSSLLDAKMFVKQSAAVSASSASSCAILLSIHKKILLVLGGRYDKDRYIFDAGASGFILPFFHVADLKGVGGYLAPGLDITNTVNRDQLELVSQDDGRPCTGLSDPR